MDDMNDAFVEELLALVVKLQRHGVTNQNILNYLAQLLLKARP
jgi:hypothetical protein